MGYLHTVIHRVLSNGRFHSLKETEMMSGRSKSFCRALFLQRDIAVFASFCNFTLRFIVSLSMNYNSFLVLYTVRCRVVVSSVFLLSSDKTQCFCSVSVTSVLATLLYSIRSVTFVFFYIYL